MREKNKIWVDLIDIRESQVKISIGIVTLLVMFLRYFDIYGKFDIYSEAIENIIMWLFGGYIGLLGFTLSGIAIVTALFSKENYEIINGEENVKNLFQKNINRFFFLAKVIGCCVLGIAVTYFCIKSDKDIAPHVVFWIWTVAFVYLIVFSFTYTINITNQIIKMYNIKNKLDLVADFKRSIIDDANEIRIDIALQLLAKKMGVKYSDLTKDIINIASKSEYDSKNEIVEYLTSHYDFDDKK